MRVWESGGVLHGYAKITAPREHPLDIPEDQVRRHAADGGYFICICLEQALAGKPDRRVVLVTAP